MNIPCYCLVCLGSNFNAELHLKNAETALGNLFPDIRWGEIVDTAPDGDKHPVPNYRNRIAGFRTTLTEKEVTGMMKEIERANGRSPEDKTKGIVPLDIDLLQYGSHILKPLDFDKEYVRKALAAFSDREDT